MRLESELEIMTEATIKARMTPKQRKEYEEKKRLLKESGAHYERF